MRRNGPVEQCPFGLAALVGPDRETFHGQPPQCRPQQDFIAEPPEDLDFATLLRAIDCGCHEAATRVCARIRRKADHHHPSRGIEHDSEGALLTRIGRRSKPFRTFFHIRPELRTLVFLRLSRFSQNLTDLLLREAGHDTRTPFFRDGGRSAATHHDGQCYEAPGNKTSPPHEKSSDPALPPRVTSGVRDNQRLRQAHPWGRGSPARNRIGATSRPQVQQARIGRGRPVTSSQTDGVTESLHPPARAPGGDS